MFAVNILNSLMSLLKYSWLETAARYTDNTALLMSSRSKNSTGTYRNSKIFFFFVNYEGSYCLRQRLDSRGLIGSKTKDRRSPSTYFQFYESRVSVSYHKFMSLPASPRYGWFTRSYTQITTRSQC